MFLVDGKKERVVEEDGKREEICISGESLIEYVGSLGAFFFFFLSQLFTSLIEREKWREREREREREWDSSCA